MMRLIIIWLNRILFLKLIESKLLEFNPDDNKDKNLAFLTSTKIKDFQTLENLFFEVLARDYGKRTLNKEFAYLPYLNSSLFTKESIESDCPIGYLDSNLKITLYKNSIISKKLCFHSVLFFKIIQMQGI